MGIQLTLGAADTIYGSEAPEAYMKIIRTNFDWSAKRITLEAAIWTDKAARDAGKQPIATLPTINIGPTPTPPQTVDKLNDKGNVELNDDGTRKQVEVSPGWPSFDQFEAMLGQEIIGGRNYRAIGYSLYKKLAIIANNSPIDKL